MRSSLNSSLSSSAREDLVAPSPPRPPEQNPTKADPDAAVPEARKARTEALQRRENEEIFFYTFTG